MGRTLLQIFAGVLCLSWMAQECAADRCYAPPESFSATSPHGAFQANATVAPDRHFLEVRALPSGKLAWSADADSFLGELWLTDSGELLTRSYFTFSYVFYTASGKPGPRFELGAEIPVEEREQFCGGTRSRWEYQVYYYLVRDLWTEGSRSWIYFRTFWGRIVAVDRATGTLDRDTALATRIEDHLLREAEAWISSTPRSFRGAQSTLCPNLDDNVARHLFVIRAHRLKAGERYVVAGMKELRGDQIMLAEYCLDLVYDPNSLAKRFGGKAHLAVVGLAFTMLAGIWSFLLRGKL